MLIINNLNLKCYNEKCKIVYVFAKNPKSILKIRKLFYKYPNINNIL